LGGLKLWTVLQMKRLAYLLIFALLSAQVDDAWAAVVPISSAAPLADDNDEYLPAPRRLRDEQTSGQEPVFVGLEPLTADTLPARKGVPDEWHLTTPFTPPPLYVFMSLQI
jgi:hypothetical protein